MQVELYRGEKVNIDDVYMVHLTDFFPREHQILSTYDGNKIYEENVFGEKIIVYCKDENKSVIVPSHRHTTHFTLNTIVETAKDGAGDWTECHMAVIEPFKGHEHQFLTYGSGDSYTWGSVNLSSNAIIIINRKNIDLIPQEEKNKWNIVVTDEVDIARAVKKFFKENNIPTVPYVDHAGHQMGMEYLLENNLQKRDKAINYIRDNQFDGKDDINLSISELAQILNIQHDNMNQPCDILPRLKTFLKIPNNSVSPVEFFEIIISNGFYLKENGKIGLRDDEFIYNQMLTLERQNGDISYIIDSDEIEDLYSSYMDLLVSKSYDSLTDFEKELLEQEKSKVKNLIGTKLEKASKYKKEMMERFHTRLLFSTPSELSEDDMQTIKLLFPKFEVDDVERKFHISYDEKKSRFMIAPNNDTYNYEYNSLADISKLIERKLENYKRIKPNNDSIECIMSEGAIHDEFLLNVEPQKDDETYQDYFNRLQEYFHGLQAIMDGKAVELGQNGIELTEENSSSGNIESKRIDKSSFEEVAEDSRSIDAKGKVIEDLKKAITTEISQENQQIQGE